MKTMKMQLNHGIKVAIAMTIMAAIIFPVLFSGRGTGATVKAAVKTPSYLSGLFSVKSGGTIYYRQDKTLCQYNCKSKKIKKLHKFSSKLGRLLYKYGPYIYVQTEKLVKDKWGSSYEYAGIYRYDVKTKEVKTLCQDDTGAHMIGIIDGKIYCSMTKDDKSVIIRVEDDGTQVIVVNNLGSWIEGGAGTDPCYIWDNTLYYAQAEETNAANGKKRSSDDEEDANNDTYHYMTVDGKVSDISKDKYRSIADKYVTLMKYPQKGVTNMLSSATQIQYGEKSYLYYGEGGNKKAFLIFRNESKGRKKKNIKSKKIYSIKLNKKKYNDRYISTAEAFKGQIMICEVTWYKKKKKGYAGDYTYRLLNNKGKVIKTLGRVKTKNKYAYKEW